jgi:hypothetical protein
MLAAEQFHSWDARANKAISHLCPAIEHALATGRPVSVGRYPASYGQREFVALAVDLCRRASLNVGIVSTSDDTISVVPLSVTPAFSRAKLEATRPVRGRSVDTRLVV